MQRETVKTEGIILKRTNYKDADRILSIFTKDLGKISAIAKGVRKIESKKRSHLELLNQSIIYLIKTGDYYLITQATSTKSYKNIKKNIDLTECSLVILEVLIKSLQENEKNETIYRLTLKTFDFLDKSQNKIFIIAFMIKHLRIEGFYSKKQIAEFIKYQPISDQDEIINLCNKIEESIYEDLSSIEIKKEAFESLFSMLKSYYREYLDLHLKSQLYLTF